MFVELTINTRILVMQAVLTLSPLGAGALVQQSHAKLLLCA